VTVGAENGDLIDLPSVKAKIDRPLMEIIRGNRIRRRGVCRCASSCQVAGSGRRWKISSAVETAAFDDSGSSRIALNLDLARQLLVNTAQIENQNAINEDEKIIVAEEA
jgi:hypothetical protein